MRYCKTKTLTQTYLNANACAYTLARFYLTNTAILRETKYF